MRMYSNGYFRAAVALLSLMVLAGGASAQARARTTKSATKSTIKSAPKIATKDTVTACPGGKGLPATAISELLDAQNSIRSQLKLGKLTWNCNMATYAQEWANRGVFEHRADRKYGENIYASSNADVTLTTVVQKWATERDYWNNAEGTCAPGKTCTHFTQIVWRSTTQIGCGINRNASGKWKVFLVCNYDPAGGSNSPAY